MKIANRERWASGFYWVGVVMTIGAIMLVLAGNTKWGAMVQHTSFPLAWKFAIVAVVAFLAGEICHPAFPFRREGDHDASRAIDQSPYEI